MAVATGGDCGADPLGSARGKSLLMGLMKHGRRGWLRKNGFAARMRRGQSVVTHDEGRRRKEKLRLGSLLLAEDQLVKRIKLQPHIIKKIANFDNKELLTKRGMRSWLSLLNYARNYIPNLGKLLSPLYAKISPTGDKRMNSQDWALVTQIKENVQRLPDLEVPPKIVLPSLKLTVAWRDREESVSGKRANLTRRLLKGFVHMPVASSPQSNPLLMPKYML
ncbi:hypothetical protein ZIOFF_022351 [Zingiber officinale]|uniref:Uncharacterized protein n=1 Tax=Zingiber officinale TaxID=94328 RepID=A0A8J5LHC7_ZINOF|nr:hypothetical protein ZIOFF_022351 [Zingiber officinale]